MEIEFEFSNFRVALLAEGDGYKLMDLTQASGFNSVVLFDS